MSLLFMEKKLVYLIVDIFRFVWQPSRYNCPQSSLSTAELAVLKSSIDRQWTTHCIDFGFLVREGGGRREAMTVNKQEQNKSAQTIIKHQTEIIWATKPPPLFWYFGANFTFGIEPPPLGSNCVL